MTPGIRQNAACLSCSPGGQTSLASVGNRVKHQRRQLHGGRVGVNHGDDMRKLKGQMGNGRGERRAGEKTRKRVRRREGRQRRRDRHWREEKMERLRDDPGETCATWQGNKEGEKRARGREGGQVN